MERGKITTALNSNRKQLCLEQRQLALSTYSPISTLDQDTTYLFHSYGKCIHILGFLQQMTEVYSFPVLEVGSLKSKCQQGDTFSLKALWEDPSSHLLAFNGSRCSLACGNLCLQFHMAFSSVSSVLQGHLSLNLELIWLIQENLTSGSLT